jgi:hypothetical protein
MRAIQRLGLAACAVAVKAGFDERANEVRTIQAGGVPGGSRPSIHRREGE